MKGTYRLGEKIAESPRAEVYRGEDLNEHRPIAVKVLRRTHVPQPEALARFKLELEIVRRLAHPHVVRVFDADELPGGGPYLAMELLAGETLASRLARQGRLHVSEVVRVVAQVGAALGAMHRHSIVHRDMRPDKVFLVQNAGSSEFVKVLDFGLCSVHGGVPFHQLDRAARAYQAPELTRGGVIADHRVDVFALGVMTYELLTGENPFAAAAAEEPLRPSFVAPGPPSKLVREVPTTIDRVVLRALEQEPNKRHDSISRFIAALESAAAGSTTRQRRVRATNPRPTPARIPSSHPAESPAAHALTLARTAFFDGRLDDAVEAAEILWEGAVLGADPEYRRLVATSLSLLHRIFAERLGSRDGRIGVGPAGRDLDNSNFTAKARELIQLADANISVARLIAASGVPPRDAERMIAGLLRRRALVTF